MLKIKDCAGELKGCFHFSDIYGIIPKQRRDSMEKQFVKGALIGLLIGLLIGMALSYMLYNRYEISQAQNPTNTGSIKIDKITGKTWVFMFSGSGGNWKAIKE